MKLTEIALFLYSLVYVQAKFNQNKNRKTISAASVVYPNSLTQYQTFSSARHKNHSVRFVQPDLCNADLKQYSGYLDLGQDVHYYFWFFESKEDSNPFTVWLNGGPGCSSMIGLWQENGPCRSIGNTTKIEYNPHTWTSHSNMLFLDQPLGTGLSYGNKTNVAENPRLFYEAIQLFYEAFPKYSRLPFHLFGESFAGRYIPIYSHYIVKRNKHQQEKHRIPIESIGIGNGWINPLIQFRYGATMACESSYGQLVSQETCDTMKRVYVQCANLVKECYEKDDNASCVVADSYCTNNIDGNFALSKRNYYDVRKGEDVIEPPQEYVNILNQPSIQAKIGASVQYEECSDDPYNAISSTGESARESSSAIEYVLRHGVRFLNYAGDADYICNWYGNHALMLELKHDESDIFAAQTLRPWYHENAEVGQIQNTSQVAFVRVYEAGHEVPYYQPKVALAMFDNWINKNPF